MDPRPALSRPQALSTFTFAHIHHNSNSKPQTQIKMTITRTKSIKKSNPSKKNRTTASDSLFAVHKSEPTTPPKKKQKKPKLTRGDNCIMMDGKRIKTYHYTLFSSLPRCITCKVDCLLTAAEMYQGGDNCGEMIECDK